jgi:hypothetical protein
MVATKQVRDVSPIPPGRYWITIQGAGLIRDFDTWLREMRGAVRVQTSSLDQSGPQPLAFVIFNVPEGRAPFLNAQQFGFPNTAPPEVTSFDDVRGVTFDKDPLDVLTDAGRAVPRAVETATEVFPWLLLLVAIMLGGKALSRA